MSNNVRFGTIQSVSFNLSYSGFVFDMDIVGQNWGCGYGGYVVSDSYKGYITQEHAGALETLKRLMAHMGCSDGDIKDLKGLPCYVLMRQSRIQAISPVGLFDDNGNAMYKWFNWVETMRSVRKELGIE